MGPGERLRYLVGAMQHDIVRDYQQRQREAYQSSHPVADLVPPEHIYPVRARRRPTSVRPSKPYTPRVDPLEVEVQALGLKALRANSEAHNASDETVRRRAYKEKHEALLGLMLARVQHVKGVRVGLEVQSGNPGSSRIEFVSVEVDHLYVRGSKRFHLPFPDFIQLTREYGIEDYKSLIGEWDFQRGASFARTA